MDPGYVDIAGYPTWMVLVGDHEETVLLLHGGLSGSDPLLGTIGPGLGRSFRIAAFDRRGHGRTADSPAAFHYDTMADETIAVLEHLGRPAHLVGWSDGGNIALLVALRRPDLVHRLVAIGSNYHHSGLRSLSCLDEVMPKVREAYGEVSPDGIEHFETIHAKSVAMFATEPTLTTADLANVLCPVLVLVGDDDMVELNHTCSMFESIPAAQLAVVPGASHALPVEQPAECVAIITRFLTSPLPPVTFMPSRRGSATSAE